MTNNTVPELVAIGHGNMVTALAFSSDGTTLISGSADQTAVVWDIETGQMRRLLRLRDFVSSLALTPDGTRLFTDDGHVWDVPTGRLLRRSRRWRIMAPLACSPDGRIVAISAFLPHSAGACILLTDVRTGMTIHKFPCGEQQPATVAFSSDGELVAAVDYESAGYGDNYEDNKEGEEKEGEKDKNASSYFITVFNLRTAETRHVVLEAAYRTQFNVYQENPHQVLRNEEVALFGVNPGSDVRLVAVSLDGGQIWNAETGEALKTVVELRPDHSVHDDRCVSLSPDGTLLAVGSCKGVVSVWDVAASTQLWQAEAHRGWVYALALSPDGRTLATGSTDRTIRLWDAGNGTPIRTLGGRGAPVEAAAFSTDGEEITTLHDDGAARLWRIAPPACERQERGSYGVLALGAPRKPDTARNLWSVPIASLPTDAEMPGGFTIAAVSPDGSLVALRTVGGSVSIWNRGEHRFQCTLPDAQMAGGKPAFSPDNRILAVDALSSPLESDEFPDRIQLFDTLTGNLSKELDVSDMFTMGTSKFAFSSDSRQLAVGHSGLYLTLWSVRTGKRKRLIKLKRDDISALAFSPDAKILAVGTAYESNLWLRSLTRGRKNVELVGHTDSMRSVDFAPDGTRVVTGAQDGTARLWDAERGELLATLMTLPDDEWIVYMPDGSYTGSPRAEDYILWRTGEDLVPALSHL